MHPRSAYDFIKERCFSLKQQYAFTAIIFTFTNDRTETLPIERYWTPRLAVSTTRIKNTFFSVATWPGFFRTTTWKMSHPKDQTDPSTSRVGVSAIFLVPKLRNL